LKWIIWKYCQKCETRKRSQGWREWDLNLEVLAKYLGTTMPHHLEVLSCIALLIKTEFIIVNS
jgi:hypothetical protein